MSFRIITIVAILAFATGCSTVKGWFGKDAEKAAIAPAPLVEIASPIATGEVWSRNLGDGRERQGLRQRPAVDGERLYVSNDAGHVLALSAATGETLWDSEGVRTGRAGSRWAFWKRRTVDGGLSGGPSAGEGIVVAGGRNGEVVAFDAGTGAERWQANVTSEVISSPLVTGGLVIVRSNDGRTFGFDAATGDRKWVFDRGLPNLSLRGNGSPVAGGGLVYLGYDDGTVIALRTADGSLAWEQLIAEPEGRNDLERMADVDGELVATDVELFASSFGGQTMAISLQNGRPLWGRDVASYGGLALAGDRLLVSDPDGTLWALDRTTGNALWKQDVLARRWLTTPAVQGAYAVVGDVEGYLHWVRIEDGVVAGRERIGNSPILATPQVSAAGMLYALTAEGELAAFAPVQ
jgi:outer membrane protein assembly factor BamB